MLLLPQKLQILRDLKETGCRFNGDRLDLEQATPPAIRKSLGRKVPWLFLKQTVDQVRQNVRRDLTLEGEQIIGNSFVVQRSEDGDGRLTFSIDWSVDLRPFFEKPGSKTKQKTYTTVTKEHIVQYCTSVFDAPAMCFPTPANYPKDWFILMMLLRSSHSEVPSDTAILKTHEALKPMNRKKKIEISVISDKEAPNSHQEQSELISHVSVPVSVQQKVGDSAE